MFRVPNLPKRYCRRFPRVRGDVPLNEKQRRNVIKFSPRARGCSC